jgi:hypothetical protein
MHDNIFSSGDWLKIKIKFSGVCLNCKQKINAGDFGYWSRNIKSIVHASCYLESNKIDQVANPVANRHEIGLSIGDKNDDTTTLRQLKNEACFICNKSVNFNDPLIIELIKVKDKSDQLKSWYCVDCLKGFNTIVYEAYKTSFNRKIKK